MHYKLDDFGNLFGRVICLPLLESVHHCGLPDLVESAGIERLSVAKNRAWDNRGELNSTIAVVCICILGLDSKEESV